MRLCIGLCVSLFFMSCLSAQTLDLEQIDKQLIDKFQKPVFSLSGRLSSSGVYYHSVGSQGRLPFTYFLTGNLQIGVYDWEVPLSYSYTNQGTNFAYTLPFDLNRLSLHPKYKSLQFHLGDASMNFSPYTYNGLPFTGFGFEFVPEEFPLRGSVFVGRLQRAVAYNPAIQESKPYYERWGYGLNLHWVKPEYEFRAIGFYAQDEASSLKEIFPASVNVRPERGVSYSFLTKIKPFSFLDIFAEYAISAIIEDVRLVPKRIILAEPTARKYNAFNAGMTFSLGWGSVGIRYERIDPDYKTLGAYYFVNDLENITLNTSVRMLQNSLTVTANIGKQRDNLKDQKIVDANQWVGALNIAYKPTEKLDFSLNYSNFTSFTNRRLNQFDYINHNPLHLQRPEDSLNYQQVAQNVLATFQYQLDENQNFILNYSVNDVVSRENDVIRDEGMSRFHNVAVTYSLGLPKNKLSISPMFNITQSRVSGQNSFLLGPSLNVNKVLLSDKLTASLGGSYNYGRQLSVTNQNAIFRLSLGYILLKRHQFQFSVVQSFHKKLTDNDLQHREELIINLGYSYHLEKTPLLTQWFTSGKKINLKKESSSIQDNSIITASKTLSTKESTEVIVENLYTDDKPIKASTTIRLKHNKQVLKGSTQSLTQQLALIAKSENYSELRYMPQMEQHLDSILQVLHTVEADISLYRKEANRYFQLLNQVKHKQRELSEIVFGVLQKLYNEAVIADSRIKQRVLDSKQNLDKQQATSQEQNFENSFEIYVIHHQMKKDFYGLSVAQIAQPHGLIQELLEHTKTAIYKVLENKKQSKLEKTNAIQLIITDYYYKKYKQQI